MPQTRRLPSIGAFLFGFRLNPNLETADFAEGADKQNLGTETGWKGLVHTSETKSAFPSAKFVSSAVLIPVFGLKILVAFMGFSA
jgi:hypothetical protein